MRGFIKKHKWLLVWSMVGLLAIAVLSARLYLNVWLPRYVNQVLANIPGYEGSVEDIDIALYRGAYKIHKLKLNKKKGNIPTPFISVETADLSIQWGALIHGRIVSNVDLIKPEIHFAVNRSGTATQTGAGVDWSKPIKDLMPIDINLVTFAEGKLSYQDFSKKPQVNVYIHNMSGDARNLRNIEDKSQDLPSTLVVKGDSIGKGKLAINGKLNILRPVPDMDMNLKLENVHLPALSDYSRAYAKVDIREGNLNVYSEFKIKNNHVSGYVKPIATKVALIDLRKPTNPIRLAWELLVAAVVEIFTNQPRDQFATKIPLEGELKDVDTDKWAAVVGIVRNAFVEAFKKGFDEG